MGTIIIIFIIVMAISGSVIYTTFVDFRNLYYEILETKQDTIAVLLFLLFKLTFSRKNLKKHVDEFINYYQYQKDIVFEKFKKHNTY